ncbi:MAG: sulfur carrier protein ThiS [Planctomycetota bacterium]|jgi:sulfur carrier protein
MSTSQPSPRHSTICLLVNEERVEVPAGTNVQQLLQQLGLQRRGLAVEVNGEIVSQRSFDERLLQGDDRVEVVSLMGGG